MSHVQRASELSAHWRKSSRSKTGSECVEIAYLGGAAAIRDSKDPSGPALIVARAEFSSLLTAVRNGQINGG